MRRRRRRAAGCWSSLNSSQESHAFGGEELGAASSERAGRQSRYPWQQGAHAKLTVRTPNDRSGRQESPCPAFCGSRRGAGGLPTKTVLFPQARKLLCDLVAAAWTAGRCVCVRVVWCGVVCVWCACGVRVVCVWCGGVRRGFDVRLSVQRVVHAGDTTTENNYSSTEHLAHMQMEELSRTFLARAHETRSSQLKTNATRDRQ